MRSKGFRLVLFLIGGWLAATANSAVAPAQGKRVAMVIGNSAYQHTLRRPAIGRCRGSIPRSGPDSICMRRHRAGPSPPVRCSSARRRRPGRRPRTPPAVPYSARSLPDTMGQFSQSSRVRASRNSSKKPLPPLPIRPLRRNRPRSIPSTAFGWERTRVEKPVRGPAPGRWSFNKVWSKVWAVRSTPWASSPSITLPGLTPR